MLRHEYRTVERPAPAVCGIEGCLLPATYNCRADLIQPSGAISPGATQPACAQHAVEWLRWSITDPPENGAR